MKRKQIVPFGSWKSPITVDDVFARIVGIGGVQQEQGNLYWGENRPDGRKVIVRRMPDGQIEDVTPPAYNARTRVHEYGGGDYLVVDDIVYFVNFSDQCLYRQAPGTEPQKVTKVSGMRYADFIMDHRRARLISVREDHTTEAAQAVNSIVAVDLNGKDDCVLVAGNDFYSTPRLSQDGKQLAWLTWNHPNMPWDGTELWVSDVLPDGSLGSHTLVAGGAAESIFQPKWSPDGWLYFVSDRIGWWNLYRWRSGNVEPLHSMEAEFGKPQWALGMSTYGFASAGRLICAYTKNGQYYLAALDTNSKEFRILAIPYTTIPELHVKDDQVYLIAGSATDALALIQLELSTGQMNVLRRGREITLDRTYFSIGQDIEFPTDGGLTAHGFFYPPVNRDFSGPVDESPPLLVMSHGGPTGATVSVLSYSIQYWTTRGIAVLDVNYGGSAGYGRAYRERLKGQWGIVDVADCINGARYLVNQGLADGNRLAITGGSAGGFTTLCALTFHDTFKAGASYYGVSDLEALAKDTHKFESRYLDGLVGPYPERRDIYLARSPIHHIEQLACPMIILQGLEDPVVPPNQAKMMYEAILARKLPVAYLTFPGEQHGFRKAENNKRALEAELYFYAQIFKFKPFETIEAIPIDNL
jgi:dipeptidyl aminopeptidase/acylaminoacyl peptidase